MKPPVQNNTVGQITIRRRVDKKECRTLRTGRRQTQAVSFNAWLADLHSGRVPVSHSLTT